MLVTKYIQPSIAPFDLGADSFIISDPQKKHFGSNPGSNPEPVYLNGLEWLANSVAGCLAMAVTYPLHTLHTRLSLTLGLSASTDANSYLAALREISVTQGLFRGLYSGFSAAIPGLLVHELGLVLGDKIFHSLFGGTPNKETEQPLFLFLNICLRSALANFLSFPFDLVCARMQAGLGHLGKNLNLNLNFSFNYNGSNYYYGSNFGAGEVGQGLIGCVKAIYQQQGICGFYQGLRWRLMWVIPFGCFLALVFGWSQKKKEKMVFEEKFITIKSRRVKVQKCSDIQQKFHVFIRARRMESCF